MSKELIIAILALAFAGCSGALLIVIAKLDEQKQMTAAEHANYIAALQIANDSAVYSQQLQELIEQGKLREKCQAQSVLWFADQLKYWKEANDDKVKDILHYHKECEKLAAERDALQDFKSSKLCPRNDHIWIDGRCKRCGRESPLPDLYVITDYGASGDPGPRGVEV